MDRTDFSTFEARTLPIPDPRSARGDLRETREALTKATRAVNQSGLTGANREVTFTIDTATKRPVVKVLAADTKEVVAQWPSEYLLRVAEELKNSKKTSR